MKDIRVLAALLVLYPAVLCVSLANTGVGYRPTFHGIAGTCLMVGFIPLFLRARFSFGYLIGFGFYGVVAGFVWITHYSGLNYDHVRARYSAIACLATFLLPLLFLTAPLPRPMAVSPRTMDRLCYLMLAIAAG